MTIKDLLDMANNGDPRAVEHVARYPEMARLLAAGMPETRGFHKVTWPGELYGSAYAGYHFCFFGPAIDADQTHDCPYFAVSKQSDGAPMLIVQTWLTTVHVDGCGTWGEIMWTPTNGEAVTICGVEKAHGAGELARIYHALGLARHMIRNGRPPGSGAYSDKAEFAEALGQAMANLCADCRRVTQERVARELYVSEAQLRRILKLHDLKWQDVKPRSY